MMVDVDTRGLGQGDPYPLPPVEAPVLGWEDSARFERMGWDSPPPMRMRPSHIRKVHPSVIGFAGLGQSPSTDPSTCLSICEQGNLQSAAAGDTSPPSDCVSLCAPTGYAVNPAVLQPSAASGTPLYVATGVPTTGPVQPTVVAPVVKPLAAATPCAWYQAKNAATGQCELGGSMLIAAAALGGVFLFTFGSTR
jgi:hypothetical protein